MTNIHKVRKKTDDKQDLAAPFFLTEWNVSLRISFSTHDTELFN